MTTFADARRAAMLGALLAGGLALQAHAPEAHAQDGRPRSLTLYDQPDYRGASVTFFADNANIGSTGFSNRARSAQVRGTWRLCEGGGYRNRCEVMSANVRDLDAYGLAGRIGSAQLLEGAAAVPPQRFGRPEPAPYGAPGPYAAQPAYPPYSAYPTPYPARPYEPAPSDAPAAVDRPSGAPGRLGRLPPPPYAPPPAAAPAPYPAPPSGPASLPYDPAGYGAAPVPGDTAVFFPAPEMRGYAISAASGQAADAFCRSQGLGGAVYFDRARRQPRAMDMTGRVVGEGPVLGDVLCRRWGDAPSAPARERLRR